MNETKQLTKDHLKHIDLNDQNFHQIIQSELSELDIIYLSSNNSLTVKQINILFQNDIPNANINLLRNPLCPLENIKKYLEQKDKIYNIAIASNEALPFEILESLVTFNDLDVDIAIAFNPTTPKDIIKTLIKKDNAQLNIALDQNYYF